MMVRGRNFIECPRLFRPALSCALPIVCTCTSGISRLSQSISEYLNGAHSHMHRRHTITGSLSIWEPDTPINKAGKEKLRQAAEKLAETGFDQTDLGASEAVLVLFLPGDFDELLDPLFRLFSRGLLVTNGGFEALGGPGRRQSHDSNGALREFSQMANADRGYRVSPSAVNALKTIQGGGSPESKHHRVRAAKLAAVLCAGRRFLSEAPPAITLADVQNAFALLKLAGRPARACTILDAQDQAFFQRMLTAFPPEQHPLIPLTTVQQRIRRSRVKGAKPVRTTLQSLEDSGHIRMIYTTPAPKRLGGRPKRFIKLVRPALPAARQESTQVLLLPPISGACQMV